MCKRIVPFVHARVPMAAITDVMCERCDDMMQLDEGAPVHGEQCDQCGTLWCAACWLDTRHGWRVWNCAAVSRSMCPSCIIQRGEPAHDENTCARCVDLTNRVAESRKKSRSTPAPPRSTPHATWIRMLAVVDDVGASSATAIAARYPSPMALMDAYRAWTTGAPEQMLLGVMLPSGRHVSPAAARAVCAVFFASVQSS